MDLYALGLILLINIPGVLSPGPDVFLILRLATKSRANALAAVAGVSAGVTLWVTLTVFGAAAVLTTFPSLVGAIQLVGGLWLLYMAYGLAKSAREQWGQPPITIAEARTIGSPLDSFRQGLFTNLSNPKVVVYFSAIMAPLMPTSAPLWFSLVLIVLIVGEVLLLHGLVGVTVSTEKIKRRLLGAGAYIDGGAAIIFGIFAITLLVQGSSSIFGAI